MSEATTPERSLLMRLRQWDALDIPGTDGSFWKREIDAALDAGELPPGEAVLRDGLVCARCGCSDFLVEAQPAAVAGEAADSSEASGSAIPARPTLPGDEMAQIEQACQLSAAEWRAVAERAESDRAGYSQAFYRVAEALGIPAQADTPEAVFEREMLPKIEALTKPLDMLLFCPVCGLQHVDAPESSDVFRASMMQAAGVTENVPRAWTNPPHKSHLCHRCGHVWRPADVPTNGVLGTKTRGANDSFTSMLGTPKTATSFDEFFDREYPNVEDRQGKFRNSNGYQLCWRGWEAATERAAAICRGVNNHDNPMTANDCADEIEKGLEP